MTSTDLFRASLVVWAAQSGFRARARQRPARVNARRFIERSFFLGVSWEAALLEDLRGIARDTAYEAGALRYEMPIEIPIRRIEQRHPR